MGKQPKVGDEWQTPGAWVERFQDALGGRIGLDPCYAEITGNRYQELADETWGPETDALLQPVELWQHYGPIYMNPPFSNPRPWAKRLADCTETPWLAIINTSSCSVAWHTLARAADLILFPKKRIGFVNPFTGLIDDSNRYDQTIFTTGRRFDVLKALGDHCLVVSKPACVR